jgi:hypothetical protein
MLQLDLRGLDVNEYVQILFLRIPSSLKILPFETYCGQSFESLQVFQDSKLET